MSEQVDETTPRKRRIYLAPDSEQLMIDHLHSFKDLLGCRVSSKKNHETECLQVIATGGSTHSIATDWCQLTLTAWAGRDDWDRANEIARLARALVEEAVEDGWLADRECYAVQWFSTPYNDLDPTTGQARVSQTARIILRGSYQEI